jgi:hypothetical protein
VALELTDVLLPALAFGTLVAGLAALVMAAPRCRACRERGRAEARDVTDSPSPLVQVTYRCPRCAAIVGRRILGVPGD